MKFRIGESFVLILASFLIVGVLYSCKTDDSIKQEISIDDKYLMDIPKFLRPVDHKHLPDAIVYENNLKEFSFRIEQIAFKDHMNQIVNSEEKAFEYLVTIEHLAFNKKNLENPQQASTQLSTIQNYDAAKYETRYFSVLMVRQATKQRTYAMVAMINTPGIAYKLSFITSEMFQAEHDPIFMEMLGSFRPDLTDGNVNKI